MEQEQDLLETRSGGIATLTLNRPDRLNAISPAMRDALLEALPRLGADPAVRAVVITGAGRAFCAGGDMKAMAGLGDRTYEKRVADLRHAHGVPLAVSRCPKPVVARINGVAVGAGLSIALACDFRLMVRTARCIAGFAGVGLSGDWGGAWLLPRLVGSAKAREIYLLDQPLDAAAALGCGLVTRVFDEAEFDAGCDAFLQPLASGPTLAFAAMKQNLLAAETESFAAVLDREAETTARTGMGDDHREALKAFGEKRRPAFRGR